MKFLIIALLFSSSLLYADRVEITSKSMKAENLKKEVHFIDNVKVKKGMDWLRADTVVVSFDDHNQTNKYEAIGNVSFEMHNKNTQYVGSADKVTYYPLTLVYLLEGKAIVDDTLKKRHINGDMIHLDMKTGDIEVEGNQKKPVKFIFDMEKK